MKLKKILTSIFCVGLVGTMFVSCAVKEPVQLDAVPLTQGSSHRVISFNVRYGGKGDTSVRTRAPLLLGTLQAYHPDSFGIQEGTPEWMDLFETYMTDYAYVGVGRDDGEREGEFSAVFYLKEKYEVTDSGTFWLSETPDKPSLGWDAACNRVCTWAVLKDKETGSQYAHVNTHLDHVGEQARQKGADMVLEKAQELAASMPVVVTGDFNLGEDSEIYQIMTGSVLGDAKVLAPDTMSGGTFHDYDDSQIAGQSPIDYIFVTQDTIAPVRYKIIDDKIDGYYLSDHFGLMVDFNFSD